MALSWLLHVQRSFYDLGFTLMSRLLNEQFTFFQVTDSITKAAVDIVKKKGYKKYRETMELIVNDSQYKVNDTPERCAVALVLILMEKVIDKAKEARAPPSSLDEVIEISAEFIQAIYPALMNVPRS